MAGYSVVRLAYRGPFLWQVSTKLKERRASPIE